MVEFKRIVDASRKNSLTFFVGAGVSALSKAPSWKVSLCKQVHFFVFLFQLQSVNLLFSRPFNVMSYFSFQEKHIHRMRIIETFEEKCSEIIVPSLKLTILSFPTSLVLLMRLQKASIHQKILYIITGFALELSEK
mgnify:CR=1 FL=1